MTPLPIPPFIIGEIYDYGVFVLCLFLAGAYMGSNSCDKLMVRQSPLMATVLIVIIIVLLGLRPVSIAFGDTVNYAASYRRMVPNFGTIDWSKEWLFGLFTTWCKSMGFTVYAWFLFLAIGYFGIMYYAYKKALFENAWFAILFGLSAFSTLTYGVNGLRNGLACSIVTLAIIFAAKDKNYIITGVLCFLALGIHKSTLLPMAAMVAALFVIKKPHIALTFWLISIPLSLAAGGPISSFFMGLGFDDRAEQYMSAQGIEGGTSIGKTGFRWDFLLYSAMPVWLIWHVQKTIERKRLQMGVEKTMEEEESGVYGAGILADTESMRVYNVLAVIYLLANAFWVMVIKANFSNRFAYLSWFLYPLVIAYPVIRLHIWEDQDKKAGLILLAHASFTIVMHILGKV